MLTATLKAMKLPYRQLSAFSSSLILSTCVLAAGNTLDITVTGVRGDEGTVRAGIYNSSQGFPKEEKAMVHTSVPAKKGSVSLQFSDLPPGKYAFILYHDEDNNGKMDKRFGMIPIEGYGLSNNIKAFGKPSFDECAFSIPEVKSQTVELKY